MSVSDDTAATANIYYTDALSCLEAAGLLNKDYPFLHFAQPRGILLNHSVELALKAFCMLCGASLTELSRPPFGHDLLQLFDLAHSNDLNGWMALRPNDRASLVLWNEGNVRPKGRHPWRYTSKEPIPANHDFMADFARRLIVANTLKFNGDPNEKVDLGIPEYGNKS